MCTSGCGVYTVTALSGVVQHLCFSKWCQITMWNIFLSGYVYHHMYLSPHSFFIMSSTFLHLSAGPSSADPFAVNLATYISANCFKVKAQPWRPEPNPTVPTMGSIWGGKSPLFWEITAVGIEMQPLPAIVAYICVWVVLEHHHDVPHGPALILSIGGDNDVDVLHDALKGLEERIWLQLQLK